MRPARCVILLVVALLATACETTTKTPAMTDPDFQPLALRTPDVGFRLSVEERAQVIPGLDADALERLLQRIRPDMREEVLREFQLSKPGEPIRGGISEFTEAELNPLLHEVWAPMWDDASDDFLKEGASSMPGRSLAKQRREERRRLEGRKQDE